MAYSETSLTCQLFAQNEILLYLADCNISQSPYIQTLTSKLNIPDYVNFLINNFRFYFNAITLLLQSIKAKIHSLTCNTFILFFLFKNYCFSQEFLIRIKLYLISQFRVQPKFTKILSFSIIQANIASVKKCIYE